MELWGNIMKAPRIDVDVNTFSDAGRLCRTRAILETGRRFFGNTEEEIFHERGQGLAHLKLNEREMVILLLDKRTSCDSTIMPRGEWKSARNALEKYYIQFYTTCKAYDRKQAANNQDGTTKTPQPRVQIEGNAHSKKNIVSLDSDEESSVSSDDAGDAANSPHAKRFP